MKGLEKSSPFLMPKLKNLSTSDKISDGGKKV